MSAVYRKQQQPSTPSAPASILLIEDCEADIEAFRVAMRECAPELEIHVAMNAVEAFRFLGEHAPASSPQAPCLVVLDLKLPAIDGHRVLEEIRLWPAWRDLRVSILTSSMREEDVAWARQLGASFYTKPPVWAGWLALCEQLAAAALKKRAH